MLQAVARLGITPFAIIQNDPEVPAGACAEVLADSGTPFLSVAAYDADPLPDPARCAGAIVLGGAMGVHEEGRYPYLGQVLDFMGEAVRLRLPLLGICLGGQLLAHLLGGRVTPASPHGEEGAAQVFLTDEGVRDPLFAGVSSPFTTFQWHHDSFLPPPGGRLLAYSPACPWQAFRYDRAYGVQFHPEVNRRIVATWCADAPGAAQLLAGFDGAERDFRCANRTMLANFIRGALHCVRP